MAEKLDDRLVASLEPPPRDGKDAARITYDGGHPKAVPGFGVRVTRGGRDGPVKSFVLNYRTKQGVERRYTIGRVGVFTTADARKRAKELRKQIATGADPLGEQHEHRTAPSMEELADRYRTDHAKKKGAASVAEDEGLLRQWIVPELGGKKVRDVTDADIERLHRKISEAGTKITKAGPKPRAPTPIRANRVVMLLSKMFSLAIRWKMRADNPCRGVEKNPEKARRQYLKPEELDRLVRALGKDKGKDAANVVRLLLLTGARRGEVLNARWAEFDLKAATWKKPADSTKQKRDHDVPLSAPALQLLSTMREAADTGEKRAQALEREADKKGLSSHAREAKRNAAARARLVATSPYIFPGYGNDGPLNNITRFWRDLCKRAKLSDFHIHDLRHSYASMLVSSGLSLPVIGALLGHTQAQTTQRYAHLMLDPMRAATERVGALVEAAQTGKPGAEVKQFLSGRRR